MKQCLDCVFYDKMLDDLLQPDALVEGQEGVEFHVCHVFESIPKDIIRNKKQCKYFADKN